MREILIATDKDELNALAAAKFIEIANSAIKKNGRFTVALAGGSTPKSLYRLLAGAEFKGKIDWRRVFFYFGDERCVPLTDAESNFRMARENLFDPLGTTVENVFMWQTGEISPMETADSYDNTLRSFVANSASLDLALLGMGADGHTASLFPFTPALNENSRLAVSNWVEKLNTHRLTMTFPMLNSAANIIFLVAGEEKAPAVREILEGEYHPEKYPAQDINPGDGNLYWLLDKAAAGLLSSRSASPSS
jgi:6-phosphogluconolactonase